MRREDEQTLSLPVPAVIGVLSDTHLLRGDPRTRLAPVLDLFRRANVDLILHAGDMGALELLRVLEELAPVAAVRGNADPVETLDVLPDRVLIHAGSKTLLLLHGHQGKTALTTARQAASDDIDLLVFGHSHQPHNEVIGRTLYVNPGYAGKPRFRLERSVALLHIEADGMRVEFRQLS